MSGALAHSSRARHAAALLLMLMTLLAAASGTGHGPPVWWAGLAAWGAALLLWPRLQLRHKRQALLLGGLGLGAFALTAWRGGEARWLGLLTQNTTLLAMLVGVSFLQLVRPREGEEPLPSGRGALWRTLAGVHVLGAVINLSAVFIMAERLAHGGHLQPRQAAALVRAFLAAALWSPFFAATAVALTYAPGARALDVALPGALLALVLVILAGRDIERAGGDRGTGFVGYPLRPSALWAPALLAATVAWGHYARPQWSSLALIAIASLGVASAAVLLGRGPRAGSRALFHHVRDRLPGMAGELVLFLAAAVFSSGLQSLIGSGGVWLPFSSFGPLQAALLLAVMIGLAMLGVHTVISIAMASAWLAPLQPEPTLLALVFVQAWAIGLAAGPMSGIHLALQGRFGLSAATLARSNGRYCLQAYGVAVLWLGAVGWWRG